jgi:hypothetical protein
MGMGSLLFFLLSFFLSILSVSSRSVKTPPESFQKIYEKKEEISESRRI